MTVDEARPRVRWYRQAWRVAELKAGMQIAARASPRWHRVLRSVELALRALWRAP